MLKLLKSKTILCFAVSMALYGLYGCETWTISETMKERLRAVEMWFLRRMLKISWTEKKSNLEVRRAAGVQLQRMLMMTIRQRQLDFLDMS